MKRLLLLIPLILLLAALALTVRAWLPPLLTFVGANSELIQGLESAVQIVLWLVMAGTLLFTALTGRQKAAQPPDLAPKPEAGPVTAMRQEAHGPGPAVQAARDVNVERDLVLGDNIGTQVNTGGGAYIGGHVDTGGGDFVGRDQVR